MRKIEREKMYRAQAYQHVNTDVITIVMSADDGK